MRNFSSVVVLAATILSACSPVQLSTTQIYGRWRITKVLCSDCGGPVLSLKAKVIEISKQKVVNPAGDDCETAPDFQFVQKADPGQLVTGPGKTWPSEVRSAVSAHREIFYGFVTCKGVNYIQIALTSPDSAFCFLEGGVILTLSRIG